MTTATTKGPYFRRDKNLRSADPYRDDASIPEPSICQCCKAVWSKGKWSLDPAIRKEVEHWGKPRPVICPACRRIEDGYPGGILHLAGSFLQDHKEQILKTLKNEEVATLRRNPLDRIIRLEDGGVEGITVQTTSEKLAQRLGKAVNRACGGELDIRFSHQEKLVRVYWRRD